MLSRAFGPPAQPLPAIQGDGAPLPLALQLGLAARIGGRTSPALLAAEVGRPAAVAFAFASASAERHGRALLDACATLAEAFREGGIRVAVLKGGALLQTGVVAPSLRPMSDLDLLVPARQLEEAASRAEALGFVPRARGLPPAAHQLAPARDAAGRLIELHRVVPGIRVHGRRFAWFEDLEAAHLLRPGPLPGADVPSRDVLAAHAVVHGLAQHGYAPRSYPLFRMIADVIDLGGSDDHALGHRWIREDVSPEETQALHRLGALLQAPGFTAAPEDAPEHVLLRHLVHGTLDDEYARGLRVRAVLDPLAPGGRILAILREAFALAWPDDARARQGDDGTPGAARHVTRALRPIGVAWRGALLLARSRRRR